MRRALMLLSLCYAGLAVGQDPHFSQYFSAPLYLNPGFTGAAPHHRFIANMRLQWPSLPQAFNTYAFSYDHNMDHLKSGLGLLAYTDKAGSAEQRTTNIGLLYSYKLQLNRKIVFSPGLYFGYGQRSLDLSKAIFGDQLGRRGGSDDAAVRSFRSSRWIDVATGLLMYTERSWLGISAWHLNQPNMSLLRNESRLAIKYSIHGGTRFPLYSGMREKAKISSLAPSFVYRQQGNFSQLDVGLHFHYEPIVTGLWYRGIPIFKDDFGGEFSRDAVIFNFGVQLDAFDIGYSYDFTISRIGPASGGAHELSLILNLELPESNRVRKKDKILPCPAFPERNNP